MTKTILRSSTNISRADLIEIRLPMPLASLRPQGRLRRGLTALSDSTIASRALAAFALRGGRIVTREVRDGKGRRRCG